MIRLRSKNTNYRFSDGSNEPCVYLIPIEGFDRKPLVTLEQAVQPLLAFIPDIQLNVLKAKERALKYPADLSIDESAAIILYTMEWRPYTNSLYYILNAKLRLENRECLKPWFLYLKLILTGLARLPKVQLTVYRGILLSNLEKYAIDQEIIWWGFSSCSTSRQILEDKPFFGQHSNRTLFIIHCLQGIDISKHSCYRKEKEILLLPGTTFQVRNAQKDNNNFYTIHLDEIQSSHQYLESISIDSNTDIIKENSLRFQPIESTENLKLKEIINRFKTRDHACLSHKYFTDDDMKLICEEVILIKQCRVLILRGYEMTIMGVEILAKSLENNHTLEELYLTDLSIGDEGVKILSNILSKTTITNLKRLCLNHLEITNQGAEYLAQMLKQNHSLTHLWLPKNRLTDQGIDQIFRSLLDNRTLQILSLEWNLFELNQTIQSLIRLIEMNETLVKITIDGRDLSRYDCKILKYTAKMKKNFKLSIY